MNPLDAGDLARINELADRILKLEDLDRTDRSETAKQISDAQNNLSEEIGKIIREQTAQGEVISDLSDTAARRRDVMLMAATPIIVALLGVIGIYIGSK